MGHLLRSRPNKWHVDHSAAQAGGRLDDSKFGRAVRPRRRAAGLPDDDLSVAWHDPAMDEGSGMAYDVNGRALVLGGGGVAGVAWEAGMLGGLRDAGVDLTAADVIVGTSAGAIIGSFAGHGVDVAEAIRRLPADGTGGPPIEVNMNAVLSA